MTDYGRQVEFGNSPVPEADRYGEMLGLVQLADRLWLEFIGSWISPTSDGSSTGAVLAELMRTWNRSDTRDFAAV
jgi:hypothetical protein